MNSQATRIIVLFNQVGGVAKTTLTHNLGYHLAHILIDCLPSLGLLSFVSLVAATHVLVPIETHIKAFEGTDELLQTLNSVKKANKKLLIAGFVPTRYAKNNSADVRTLGAIQEQLSSWSQVFPPIPRATAFVDASEERSPLAVYAPKHPAVILLDALTTAIEYGYKT